MDWPQHYKQHNSTITTSLDTFAYGVYMELACIKVDQLEAVSYKGMDEGNGNDNDNDNDLQGF